MNQEVIIDEFEGIKEIPTRVNLKERYPQTIMVIFARCFWFFMAIGLVLLGYLQLDSAPPTQELFVEADEGVRIFFDYLMYLLLIITAAKFTYEFIYHLMYNYSIELEHLIITQGVLFRSRVSLPIAKINDASLSRNFIELLFGIYSLDIVTITTNLPAKIHGLRKKEAVDLQAYIMLLVETTLPKVNNQAIEFMKDRELSHDEIDAFRRGDMPGKEEKREPHKPLALPGTNRG